MTFVRAFTKSYIGASAFLVFISGSAFAADPMSFHDMGNRLTPQISSVSNLLGVISFITGIILGFKGLMKLKSDKGSQIGSEAGHVLGFIYIFTASLLVAMPATMMAGVSTFGFTEYTDIEGNVLERAAFSVQSSSPQQPQSPTFNSDPGFSGMEEFGDTSPNSGNSPMQPTPPGGPDAPPDVN